MDLEVLIATMNQKNYNLLNKMNINSKAVVINQCKEKSNKIKKPEMIWVNSLEKGLSKSRNMALDNSTSDVCLLADDDLIYINNYKDIVLEQFRKYPQADIITFQVEGIEKKYKNYYFKSRKLNYLTSMKVSSVEMAFKTNSIKNNGVNFNEKFGSGAKYPSGEESIFLYDCLKNGLKIQYVPIKIADLHIGESTWFEGYNKKFFLSKGATFAAMSKIFSIPLILQYALRKYNLYKNNITMYLVIRYMISGRREYLRENSKI